MAEGLPVTCRGHAAARAIDRAAEEEEDEEEEDEEAFHWKREREGGMGKGKTRI